MRHTVVEIPEVKATCTSTGLTAGEKCSVCGKTLKEQEVIPMIPHNYVTTIIPPTENSQGYSLHTCSVCGDNYKDHYTDYVGEDVPQIVIENKTSSAGQTVTVNLFVKNNPGFNAASIKIDYDTTRLKLIGAELSEEFGNGTTVSYDNLPYLTFVRGDNINSMSASSIRRAVLKYLLLNSFIRHPPRIIPPIRLSPLQAVLSQTRISFCPRQAVSCRSDN